VRWEVLEQVNCNTPFKVCDYGISLQAAALE